MKSLLHVLACFQRVIRQHKSIMRFSFWPSLLLVSAIDEEPGEKKALVSFGVLNLKRICMDASLVVYVTLFAIPLL